MLAAWDMLLKKLTAGIAASVELTGVDPQVSVEVGRRVESLAAERALVGALSRVRLGVVIVGRRLGEPVSKYNHKFEVFCLRKTTSQGIFEVAGADIGFGQGWS